jgi:branched-chain amino acid transport system ATP-binding protein
MLELIDVHTYYGDSYILQGISLKVEKGTIVSLLGRNGMGKTTTVRSIIGFTPPRRGVIRFEDEEIHRLPPYKIASLGIALVPQGRRIFPSLSVEDNLRLGMRNKGSSLETVYTHFPRLEERKRNYGSQLSGGEQQMLAIARALLSNPKLILMDEPSEGLAPTIVKSIGDIILDLKQQGIAILLVEQNVKLSLKISDYVYILDSGRIVNECEASVLEESEELQALYFGLEKFTER